MNRWIVSMLIIALLVAGCVTPPAPSPAPTPAPAPSVQQPQPVPAPAVEPEPVPSPSVAVVDADNWENDLDQALADLDSLKNAS